MQEPESALVVQSTEAEPLAAALKSLQADPNLRIKLAEGALQAGLKYFSAEAATRLFQNCLRQSPPGDSAS
jgi:hypothetical protein